VVLAKSDLIDKLRVVLFPSTPVQVPVAGQLGAIHQGALVAAAQAEFAELRRQYWGQHMWARGYFCATVGAVDEATIKAYIENQRWDEDDDSFKITAPTKGPSRKLRPA
jgi:REP element-mobilizing transposase RayT